MGIGVEKIAEEIKKTLGIENVFVMDKDNLSTHKQAVKVRDAFYATPGSVMVGTEMALTYLNQNIQNTAVASIDAYFSIPDYQITEKIFHILINMRSLSDRNFIIQTRQENTKIFDHAIKGNLMDFYRDEIEERKSIGYPPFTTYIKLSLEGEKVGVKKQMEEIAKFLDPHTLSIFDAWNKGSREKYVIHGLVSLPEGGWVEPELLNKLKSLPGNVSIKINPASLL
jgi:primosomal protein N' (replication factor Y)